MSGKRRGAGEGNIRQRADGRWEGRIARDGASRSVYGRTQQEVVRKLNAAKSRQEKGLPFTDERATVGSFLKRWLEAVEPRLRPSTALWYRGIVEHQLLPHLGAVKLSRLQPADVAAMLSRLQASGISARTAAHARAVLRTALNDGEKWGEVSRNVAKLADPPRVPQPSPKMLPPAEVHRVLSAVAGTPIDNLVTVAIFTGMRQGELLGLRWTDVDLERGQLTVGASLQRLGRVSKLVEPKTAHSRRTLRLPAPAVDALAAERKRQLEAQLAAGPRWRPTIDGLVFTDGVGRYYVGTSVTHSLQRALTAAGLPVMRFHHLRHAFGALMLASGVDLATVSHLMGHSSVALTASTYAGILPSLRDDAAARLERLLS